MPAFRITLRLRSLFCIIQRFRASSNVTLHAIVIIVSGLLQTSCQESENTAASEVINISPSSAPKGAEVTILTRNLPFDMLRDEVLVNNVKAEVVRSSPNQIVFKVPERAGSGLVNVKVNDRVMDTKPVFSYLYTSSPFAVEGVSYLGYIIADKDNNLFAISGNQILKIKTDGTVSVFAGQYSAGYLDGAGVEARFNSPAAMATDASGNLYLTDFFNHKIRKITPAGIVSTVAGSNAGYVDGDVTQAKFNWPNGITVTKDGSLLIVDSMNRRIRKITSAGVVSTIAGSSATGLINGNALEAAFEYPTKLIAGENDKIYVIDNATALRLINTTTNQVSTLAGALEAGFRNGNGTEARFDALIAIVLDQNGDILAADLYNHRIRKIKSTGDVTTFAGVGEIPAYPVQSIYGTVDKATFWNVFAIAITPDGTIYTATHEGMFCKLD